MTALVTGATGFLGSSLVSRLLARGWKDLRCLARQGTSTAKLDAAAAGRPIEKFVGSLATPEAAADAVRGCDVVFHLAAAMGGAPADMYLSTVVTTKNLFEGILATSKPGARPRVVLVSSFGVYGVANLPRGAMVDESTPLEPEPKRRDPYSQVKLAQEKLAWDYHRREGIPLTVARPGVIYGPNGSAFSARVGLDLFGMFLHLGGRNMLPLTYVDNCSEAIAILGERPESVGEVYNVVDDELIDCADYLRRFNEAVRPVRSVSIPYPAMVLVSHAVERYHRASKGQLPAIFTPYKTASSWKGNTFANAKLKAVGWRPIVSTSDGLDRTFEYLRTKPKRAS